MGYEELHAFLRSAPKFGNADPTADAEASAIAARVSDMVTAHENYLGQPFRADWASPTTHLTYGYWVGATPDGRRAREQLNYGVDPLYGEADRGMGFRMVSTLQLPFEKMDGGYASHLGIDPKFFTAPTAEGKGLDLMRRVIRPLFFGARDPQKVAPFYLYLNVTTPETCIRDSPGDAAPRAGRSAEIRALRRVHHAHPRHVRQFPRSGACRAAGYHPAARPAVDRPVLRWIS